MVIYNLLCKKKHSFEGWFPSFEDFQKQADKKLISCPTCGTTKVEKVPHACAVLIDEFAERPDRKDHIKAKIVVESEGQKGIVVGHKGQSIKSLGQMARGEIEKRLGRAIFLELVVEVRKNWRKDWDFVKGIQNINR